MPSELLSAFLSQSTGWTHGGYRVRSALAARRRATSPGARWVRKMPSLWKRITFSVASVLCVGSVVLLVVALSTERWVTGRILCKTGAEIVNASHPELEQFIGDVYFGLFRGGKNKRCGLGSRRSNIYSKKDLCIYPAHVQVIVCEGLKFMLRG